MGSVSPRGQPGVEVDDQAVHQGGEGARARAGRRCRRRRGSRSCPGAGRAGCPSGCRTGASMTPVVNWSSAKRLELLPGVELEGQAGSRQLLEHQRPVGRVAGVDARPDRGGRGQRLQVGVGVEQRRQHRHHPLLLGQPDVHVHAPDQHLAAPPLGAVDQLLVAVPWVSSWRGPRRRTGGCQRRTGPPRARRPPGRTGPRVCRSSAMASPTVSQTPVTTSTVLRSSSLCSRVGSASRGRPRSNRSAAVLHRSRVVLSTSANSHSTPDRRPGEAWKSMRTPPSEAHRPSGSGMCTGVSAAWRMLEARDART